MTQEYTDPKTLSDDELKSRLNFAILTWAGMRTPEQTRFNRAAMSEYIRRKLSDYVIDEFLEFLGMRRL